MWYDCQQENSYFTGKAIPIVYILKGCICYRFDYFFWCTCICLILKKSISDIFIKINTNNLQYQVKCSFKDRGRFQANKWNHLNNAFVPEMLQFDPLTKNDLDFLFFCQALIYCLYLDSTWQISGFFFWNLKAKRWS